MTNLNLLRLFALLAPLANLNAADIALIENGQPRAEIIIAEKAPRMVAFAAKELQSGLKAITGAELPIVTEPTGTVPVKVFVGRSSHTDVLGVKADDLKHAAFRIVSGPAHLVLLGHDEDFEPKGPVAVKGWPGSLPASQKEWDKLTDATWGNPSDLVGKALHRKTGLWHFDEGGSFNAVCEFLRMQGMRWFWPGKLGTVTPEAKTIALPQIDRTVRPDFAVRTWMWSNYRNAMDDEMLWERRLGLSTGARVIGAGAVVHGMRNLHRRSEMKEAHPEYYALVGGKRDTTHNDTGTACFSAKGLEDEAVRYARAVLDHFDEPAVSLWPQDGFIKCGCELCRDKTPSDLVWGFIDRVAKEVYKTHPGKLVTGGAYTPYIEPPASVEKFSPNVAVYIASIQRPAFADDGQWKVFQDRIAAWQAKLAPGRIIRNSNNRYTGSAPVKERVPFPVLHPHGVAREFRAMKGISLGDWNELSRVNFGDDRRESYRAPGLDHLNLYVQAQCLWQADLDLEALLTDYYTRCYGPAAAAMRTAFEFAEAKYPREGKPTPDRVAPSDRLHFVEQLQAARTLAGDTVCAQRIQFILDELQTVEQLRREIAVAESGSGPRDDAPLALAYTGKPPANAQPYRLRDVVTGKKAALDTSFTMAWESDTLIFRIRCEEPDMANLVLGPDVHDGDSVAMLIETPEHSYYQIEVSPDGRVFNADRSNRSLNTKWNSLAQVEAERGADHWSVEVRLQVATADEGNQDPLHKIVGRHPGKGRPWFFNVGRVRLRDGEKNATAFRPTGKASYHDPAKFAKLETR